MLSTDSSKQLRVFQHSVAMTVTLISFAMMFASLFLGYFLVRFNSATWPPVEIENRPMLLPFLSTLVICISSWTYSKFQNGEKKKSYWSATLILGLMFLSLQLFLWKALAEAGIYIRHGNVPSMMYAFTWLHALHIVVAIGLLGWLGFYVFFRPTGLSEIKLTNVGKFWHFLGVIWIIMYLMLFVL
jgi:cytochrome c oxidase subunit III